MENQSEVIKVQGLPVVVAGFNWSVGFLMEKFIKSLADKKLLVSKCPKCGYVHIPPRTKCIKCQARMADGDLGNSAGKGTLSSYTVAYVELDGKGNFTDLKKPKIIGAVKLDDADSTIFVPIEGADLKKVNSGMKVEIEWSEKPKGQIADIKCFKPEKKK